MKRILVTGVTSGIGLELAKQLLDAGCAVTGVGRNEASLQALSQQYSDFSAVALDITNKSDCVEILSSLAEEFDWVVLNAGVCEYMDSGTFDADMFERVVQTNLISQGYCLQSLIPKVSSGGKIIIVSSASVYFPFLRAEAYGSAKAGLDYLSQVLQDSLCKLNIDVVLVRPGFVKTPLTDKNDFAMPFMLSVEEAVSRMIRDINNNKKLIEFPRRLKYCLKLLNLLPRTMARNVLNGG